METQEQNHASKAWYKYAMAAASIALFGGICWQAGSMPEKQQVTQVAEPRREAEKLPDTVGKNKPDHNAGMEDYSPLREDPVIMCEARSFVEGDGKRMVTEGSIIYAGEGKDVVVKEYASGHVKEIQRLSVKKEAQAFYLKDDSLFCIASDKGSNTTVHVYNIEDYSIPEEIRTWSVEGMYQCSYQEGDDLYTFTDRGKMQRINLESQETIVMDIEENGSKYYVSDETVYALKKSDKGTRVQCYQVEENSLKQGGTAVCAVPFQNIIAVSGESANLKLLGAEEDGVRLLQYDEQMRLVNDKKNSLGQNVFAGDFTGNGILVMGNEQSSLSLNMLNQESLETKNAVSMEGVEKVFIGGLALNEDASRIGFVASSKDTRKTTYYIYDYNDSNGFIKKNAKEVEESKVENEVTIGDSVLLADTDGIEVLMD